VIAAFHCGPTVDEVAVEIIERFLTCTTSYRSSLYKTVWLMKEVIDAEEEASSGGAHQQLP
jgi:hypothetical protein